MTTPNPQPGLEASPDLFMSGKVPEPLSAEQRDWLARQLSAYPNRVDPEKTCAIGALQDMATAEFCRMATRPTPDGEIGELVGRAKALLDAGISPWPWTANSAGGLRTKDGEYLSESMGGWSSPRGGEMRDRDVEMASLAPQLAYALLEARTALETQAADIARLREAEARVISIIENGYPNRESKAGKTSECPHGRFYYEDCIACYDEALLAALATRTDVR